METATIERRSTRTLKSKPPSTRKKDLREATDRVYRVYGTDLSAFYRDLRKELQKRANQENDAR
jgi:hypothetical protein